MDPDSEAKQIASTFLRTTVLSVVLTACHSYNTEKNASIATVQHSLPDDSIAATNTANQPKQKKTIYLTFDDGPNRGTRNLLNIINQEQINVSLFIVGQHVYGSAEQTATFDSILTSKYVEIANHSYTHAHNKFLKYYRVPDSVVSDFKRCADSLHLTTNIVRTPGRNVWRTKNINATDEASTASAADDLQKNNFTALGWDLEWHYNNSLRLQSSDDALITKIDSLFAQGKTKTPNCLVLLAHDQVFEDATDSAMLHQFIIKLKAKHQYNFEPVSKYPFLKN
jgi:peptidoglycan-N-acetylglucosamine deacetylase